jgi:hypothetical protein
VYLLFWLRDSKTRTEEESIVFLHPAKTIFDVLLPLMLHILMYSIVTKLKKKMKRSWCLDVVSVETQGRA